jgi:hypothetical protein
MQMNGQPTEIKEMAETICEIFFPQKFLDVHILFIGRETKH